MTCTLCAHDNAIHTITLRTGRPVFTRALEDWTYTVQKYETEYDDVLLHTYNICHRCWTRQWKILAYVLALVLLFYVALMVLLDRNTDEAIGLLLLAGPLVLIIILASILKPRMPWQRLKRLALQQRGGPPFEVFRASKDGTDWTPP